VIDERPTAIIGLGRVGSALALLLTRQGRRQLRIYDRNREKVEALTARLPATAKPDVASSPEDAVTGAGLLFIAVQDRYLESVAEQLVQGIRPAGDFSGLMAAHLSGALTAMEVLAPLRERGARVFSLHPLQSLADVEGAVRGLAGSFFSFEGDREALPTARQVVNELDGRLIELAGEDKVLYHAAAVVASNFFIALEDMAINLMAGIGVDNETPRQMLLPQIRGSFENLERVSPLEALTGPIVRGDDQTVAAHLETLREKAPHYLEAYRLLAGLNIGLARRRGEVDYGDFPSLEIGDEGGQR
jgi:predicted short-subunit dehydrogenase-like oxidoreductase (DUF2520 family)